MLNKITVMGRLTKDVELRHTQSGLAVASFSIACDRDYAGRDGGEKQVDFIDIVAWRQKGEFVSKYFHKGDSILVDGRLQMRDWMDKDGNKRRAFEVIANEVYFCGSKARSTDGAASAITDGVIVDVDDDGKLPWEDDETGLPL